MNIAVTDDKAQLTELVRRAEAGEDIVLTRRGRPTVKLVRVRSPEDIRERKRRILEIGRRAAAKATPGPDAAHSADYLYDDDGLAD
jgi:prevent-host-death family protein